MARTNFYSGRVVRAVVAVLASMAPILAGATNPTFESRQGVAGASSASATPLSFDAADSAFLNAPTVRMAAHTSQLPILTNRAARMRPIAHVRFELLLVSAGFGASEVATAFVYQLSSSRIDPVDPFVVLPGTPPPSCLG
jgi:hypothetical protein